jgi:tetratricopeptide (TPR) repeat protein
MSKASILGSAGAICLLHVSIVASQQVAQTDCALAERYYGLAKERLAAYDESEAALYLERAGIACPRHAFLQELGELRTASVNENDRRLAVDAFIESHSLASSDQERARALWKYAALLNQEGDPQNADGLVREARRLDPGNAEIAALALSVEQQVANPTRQQLVRGLADSLYKPLMMSAATSSGLA